MSGYSRYHIFKSSPTNYFLLAHSQARHLEAGNLNILSLPGTCISHAYNFIPQKTQFEIIKLFLGGNHLFDGFEPSRNSPQKVPQDLIELADFVCQRTESKVFALGIPERDENRIRASQANTILKAIAERNTPKHDVEVKWKYRSASSFSKKRD